MLTAEKTHIGELRGKTWNWKEREGGERGAAHCFNFLSVPRPAGHLHPARDIGLGEGGLLRLERGERTRQAGEGNAANKGISNCTCNCSCTPRSSENKLCKLNIKNGGWGEGVSYRYVLCLV